MVNLKNSLVLLLAALFTSANSRSVNVGAYSGLTIRDLLDHDVFSRSFQEYDSLITRDEIEELFGRHIDTDLEELSERHYEELYVRHPDHFVNFFESVGNLVKRAAHDYWQHMIRKAHIIVGKEDKKDELEFLPRDEEKPKPKPSHVHSSTRWFGEALNQLRDSWLPKDHPPPKVDASQFQSREGYDEDKWMRELFDEWHEYDERAWEDLEELD